MTVEELMALLAKLPPKALVLVSGDDYMLTLDGVTLMDQEDAEELAEDYGTKAPKAGVVTIDLKGLWGEEDEPAPSKSGGGLFSAGFATGQPKHDYGWKEPVDESVKPVGVTKPLGNLPCTSRQVNEDGVEVRTEKRSRMVYEDEAGGHWVEKDKGGWRLCVLVEGRYTYTRIIQGHAAPKASPETKDVQLPGIQGWEKADEDEEEGS